MNLQTNFFTVIELIEDIDPNSVSKINLRTSFGKNGKKDGLILDITEHVGGIPITKSIYSKTIGGNLNGEKIKTVEFKHIGSLSIEESRRFVYQTVIGTFENNGKVQLTEQEILSSTMTREEIMANEGFGKGFGTSSFVKRNHNSVKYADFSKPFTLKEQTYSQFNNSTGVVDTYKDFPVMDRNFGFENPKDSLLSAVRKMGGGDNSFVFVYGIS